MNCLSLELYERHSCTLHSRSGPSQVTLPRTIYIHTHTHVNKPFTANYAKVSTIPVNSCMPLKTQFISLYKVRVELFHFCVTSTSTGQLCGVLIVIYGLKNK